MKRPPAPKSPDRCPAETASALIGGGRKVPVLWHLSKHKVLRFSELSACMTPVSAKVLTQLLRRLEADGLVTRKVFAVVPPRVEYSLTRSGQSLTPVIDAMCAWGKRCGVRNNAGR